jgi:hypothetical protein
MRRLRTFSWLMESIFVLHLTVLGGGWMCAMPAGATASSHHAVATGADEHGTHDVTHHAAHAAEAVASGEQLGASDAPAGEHRADAPCPSAMPCGSALALSTPLDAPLSIRGPSAIVAMRVSAPRSISLAPELPPPRC